VTKQLLILCAWLGTAHAEDPDAAMGRRVQALLHAHQSDVFGCVQKEATPPTGELLVRVFVGENGATVARAEVLKNQSGSSTVGKCIDDKIRGWDITSLKASEGDQLVFPLAFKPEPKQLVKLEPITVERATREAGEAALYVVKGRIKVGADVLNPDDLAWVRGPLTIDRVDKEVPLVLEVSGMTGLPTVVRKPMAKTYPIAGGKANVTLFLDGLGEPIAIDKLVADQGVKIPPHTHAGSDELLYIVSGKGMTYVGGKPVYTAAGTVLHIPAGVEHSLTVDEPLVAVQVYAPAGPEQRFKPEAKKIAP
jgi:quercetin dioxygenase-like cupin family protein